MTEPNASIGAHVSLETATLERDMPTKPRQEWNVPRLSRLNIAETQSGGGSPADFEGFGTT